VKLLKLTPTPGELELVRHEQLREYFALQYWAAPSFLLNFVSTQAGEFVGPNQSSRDISNELDYQVLMGYRQAADGIFTTAQTARIEQYRRSRLAPLALISKTADFSGIPAVESEQSLPTNSQVFLLVKRNQVRATKARYTAPWVNVVSIGFGSAFEISFRLTRLGWRRILVEAGPKFSRWLISKSMIRGLSLTIVGVTTQNPLEAARAALAKLGIAGAELESADMIDQTMFTRWTNLEPIR
jgi:riboflavin biosynthesis pyrimidine reductase